MKYTRGPWHFAGSGLICNEHGDEIDLNTLYDGPDARLVAASPEMFTCLKRLRLEIDFTEISAETLALMQAVLAKVEAP